MFHLFKSDGSYSGGSFITGTLSMQQLMEVKSAWDKFILSEKYVEDFMKQHCTYRQNYISYVSGMFLNNDLSDKMIYILAKFTDPNVDAFAFPFREDGYIFFTGRSATSLIAEFEKASKEVLLNCMTELVKQGIQLRANVPSIP